MTVSDAERRVRSLVAIGKALVDAATDFGEGNVIAGDVWALAEAALDAMPRAAGNPLSSAPETPGGTP